MCMEGQVERVGWNSLSEREGTGGVRGSGRTDGRGKVKGWERSESGGEGKV